MAFIDFLSVPNISFCVLSECIRAWTMKSCEISVITICLFMDLTEFYRNFSAEKNISKPSASLLQHQSNGNQTIDLGRVHLLNRYNYRFTFSGYVAAHFFIGIWKRNYVFSLVLCYCPHSWDSLGMSFQKGMCLSSDFLPNHILKPLISILQKYECSFYNSSSKYLTETSKHPASSMEEDDSSPLPIRGNFRLINPHRNFVKLQILDKELWVHP